MNVWSGHILMGKARDSSIPLAASGTPYRRAAGQAMRSVCRRGQGAHGRYGLSRLYSHFHPAQTLPAMIATDVTIWSSAAAQLEAAIEISAISSWDRIWSHGLRARW